MVIHTVDRRNRDQDPDPLAGQMKKVTVMFGLRFVTFCAFFDFFDFFNIFDFS